MIHIDCDQNTPEWLALRLGIPTASEFDRLITPKTMKPSASAAGYLHEKLAEWALGSPLDEGDSIWMERGVDLETEAAATYGWETDTFPEKAGFFLTDDRMAGASPDRLVGDDGILEIKCPSAKVHVGYLFGSVAEAYRCQVQGLLWVTERRWVDVMSFNPAMPNAIVRVERDEKFIEALSEAVGAFVGRLKAGREELLRRGLKPRDPLPSGVPATGDGGSPLGIFD